MGEEEKAVAVKETKPRSTKMRRTTAAASAAGTALGTGIAPGCDGAPTGGRFGDAVVKEEGGDVVSLGRAAAVAGGGNGKKRRSPAVLMEGSRCSRVNGRGWRCCQQTLVGYSLCEHHLGKGRLRSVSSVRCNGRGRKKEEDDDDDDDGGEAAPAPPLPHQREEEKEVKPGGRRRKKIGMVKARSISSLLHQPDLPTPTLVAPPEPSPSPAPPGCGSDSTVA